MVEVLQLSNFRSQRELADQANDETLQRRLDNARNWVRAIEIELAEVRALMEQEDLKLANHGLQGL